MDGLERGRIVGGCVFSTFSIVCSVGECPCARNCPPSVEWESGEQGKWFSFCQCVQWKAGGVFFRVTREGLITRVRFASSLVTGDAGRWWQVRVTGLGALGRSQQQGHLNGRWVRKGGVFGVWSTCSEGLGFALMFWLCWGFGISHHPVLYWNGIFS